MHSLTHSLTMCMVIYSRSRHIVSFSHSCLIFFILIIIDYYYYKMTGDVAKYLFCLTFVLRPIVFDVRGWLAISCADIFFCSVSVSTIVFLKIDKDIRGKWGILRNHLFDCRQIILKTKYQFYPDNIIVGSFPYSRKIINDIFPLS